MSITLNNILGVSGKPTAPYTPPGIDSSLPGVAGTQPRQNITDTPQAVQPAPAQQEEPQQPKRLSYEEMFRQLNPYKPPTQEELEKERKKQRREQIFAAIGDGISALSNLYFTTQYAPNMYSGRNTASQRVKDRWDKLAADRNANMTAYINGLMRARQADDAYNDNERQWARQLGLDKIKQQRDAAADARAEAKAQQDKEMHDLNVKLRNNQITKSEYDAKKAEVEAKYAEKQQEATLEQKKHPPVHRGNAASTMTVAVQALARKRICRKPTTTG